MNTGDSELLARYLDMKDESAFARLVEVYGGLVLGAARRVTGETEAAKEASQSTFIALARKAASLRGRQSLGGWLHHTAMLSARNVVRSKRREERKRAAVRETIEPASGSSPEQDWELFGPILDDSLASLSERDRTAIVLRFYRECSVQEVASHMQVTLAAAQKRLGRALEKLRSNFQRRGVDVSLPALGAGLGMWGAHSQCAAALTVAWASAAKAGATGAIGSSWTLTSILTAMTMTKSKMTTTVVATALLLGGGVLAWNKTKERGTGAAPSAVPGGPPSSSTKSPRSGAGNSSAIRINEMIAKYGSERVRQARRIVSLLGARYNAESESALVALDLATAEWLKETKAKWGLDEAAAQELAALMGKAHDQRVSEFKNAVYRMGEERAASALEAILLADQVANGELSRDDFEVACHRLSRMDSPQELELRMGSLFSFEAYFFNEEFAAAVAEIIPANRRQGFRSEVQEATDRLMASQMAVVKQHVPDLSDQQVEQLTAFYRRTGVCYPRRSMLEPFLTEAQNTAWFAQSQSQDAQRAQALTQLPLIGPGGEERIPEGPAMRMPIDGAPAVYPWQEPMTLDDAEQEAEQLTQGDSSSLPRSDDVFIIEKN